MNWDRLDNKIRCLYVSFGIVRQEAGSKYREMSRKTKTLRELFQLTIRKLSQMVWQNVKFIGINNNFTLNETVCAAQVSKCEAF